MSFFLIKINLFFLKTIRLNFKYFTIHPHNNRAESRPAVPSEAGDWREFCVGFFQRLAYIILKKQQNAKLVPKRGRRLERVVTGCLFSFLLRDIAIKKQIAYPAFLFFITFQIQNRLKFL